MVMWRRKKTADTGAVPRPRWVRLLRLLVRGVLATLMWLIILVALLMLGLYGSGTMREKLLGVGLDVAAKSVPGRIELAQADWPEPGHLRLTDLVWSDGDSPPDTLAHISVLDLRVDLEALRHKDVAVDSLLVVASSLDGPAIERVLLAWASSKPDTTRAEAAVDSTGQPGFPRPGAIAGWPSVALSHWQVELAQADLTADIAVDNLVFKGALEARHGHQAQAVVEHLELDFSTTAFDSLTGEPWKLSLQHLGLGVTLDGAADSAATGESFVAVMDSLSLRFDAMGHDAGDSVRTWRQASGPVRLANTARISHTDAGYRGIFTSDFVLPGAQELQAFLPADFPHERFDQIVGSLSLDGVYDRPRLDLKVALDLGPTSWLDSGLLTGHLDSDLDDIVATGLGAVSVELDTLDIALLGAELSAAGALRLGALELDLHAAVTDTHLVAVLLPDSLAGTEALFDLKAQLGGTIQAPELVMTLQGELHSPPITVPRLELQVSGDLAGGQLDMALPAGLITPSAQLDSLHTRAEVERDADDVLAGKFALDAWRGADRLAIGGQVWADSLGRAAHRKVQLDSLVVVGFGQDVRLQEPAVLELGPGPWDLDLSPLVIAGDPGELTVGGRLDEAGMDLASQLAIFLPEDLLAVLAPSGFWSADGGQDFSLKANFDLQGTRTEPTLEGQLEARLIPRRGDSSLGVDLKVALAAGDSAGVHSEMAVILADSTVLTGTADMLGRFDSKTGAWQHTPGEPARFAVPEQTLGLVHLNRLLPPEVSLEGDLAVALAVEIPLDKAPADSSALSGSVTGYVRAPQLAVRLPNRSRVDTNVDLQFTGDLKNPIVGGRITVESGFFRLPELPRSLLAAEGEPLLWALADSVSALPESLQVFVMPEAAGPELSPSGPGFLPEMDLEILVPGNLRIHGYGLDIELSGDLKVGRGFDEDEQPQPKVHGNVIVVQGTLQFMNRVFKVERGEVRFNGAVPPDPTLDLKLEVDVSGTLVRIQVSGQASDPVIELSSEPDYQEQDIMAVLLFGRPLSELDNDQRGGVNGEDSAGQELRQNLAGLAMAFGTAGLQNSVSNSLGVDMVEMGSGSAGDSTLMVGKFINPKLMLKYHHSLEKSGTYYLTMEYTLTRILKVVTTYGQGEEDSGLELKWTRRY